MIVQANTPADVRDAVLTARDQNMRLAMYATGHGGPMPDGEDVVVVTTAGLGATVLVDPDRRTAWAGAGARWADVLAAATPFGLAPLSGSHATVGVVGYTLGGGMSWLSRRYGFAADSVTRAEVITADGEHRIVSEDRDPDLFWALRGGGPNFAAVLGLEFRLHPVWDVYAGEATFAADRAEEVLTHYRDHAPTMPDELSANILLTKNAVTIRGVYAGPKEDARRALAPLFRAAGAPRTNTWRTQPYAHAAVPLAGPTHFNHLAALPPEAMEAILEATQDEENAVEVRYWGGAISRTEPTPAGRRAEPFVVIAEASAEAAAKIATHATGGTFLNSLHGPTPTRTAFTPENYTQLRAVKHAYDPTNLFGLAKNILPARPAQNRRPA
jgi:FAD/FMN-containing dehydrogenase